jgi:hypothetical protein
MAETGLHIDIGGVGEILKPFGETMDTVAAATIEEAITALLKNNIEVKGLCSARVYPLTIPQKAALPAVTYQKIAGSPFYTLSGPNILRSARFQVTAFAASYSAARGLQKAVENAMNYRGLIDTVEIQSVELTDDGDVPYIDAAAEAKKVCARRMDFEIFYKEF